MTKLGKEERLTKQRQRDLRARLAKELHIEVVKQVTNTDHQHHVAKDFCSPEVAFG